MLRLRLVGFAFIAILALSAVAASVASAAAPEFSPATTQKFTGTSKSGTLENSTGNEAITCTGDSNAGEITGAHTVGNVVVTFTGCTGNKSGTICTTKSVGAGEGDIVTHTLKGELGLTGQSKTGVGLLLEPASGSEFVKIAKTSCTTEAAVEGKIAGEATPIKGGASTTGKLIFTGSKGTQNITAINVLGTTVKPALKAFLGLVSASETTEEEVKYTKAVEVT